MTVETDLLRDRMSACGRDSGGDGAASDPRRRHVGRAGLPRQPVAVPITAVRSDLRRRRHAAADSHHAGLGVGIVGATVSSASAGSAWILPRSAIHAIRNASWWASGPIDRVARGVMIGKTGLGHRWIRARRVGSMPVMTLLEFPGVSQALDDRVGG